jgi:ABC-type lipoprotein release transport system permease subunit
VAAVCVLLLALLASCFPALRAARLDPLRALRQG